MCKFLTLLTLFCLFSCATPTPYQQLNTNGGYSEKQVGPEMFYVYFSANKVTFSETVNNYLMNRCAELTQEKGYSHFIIVSKELNGEPQVTQSSDFLDKTKSVLIKMTNDPKPGEMALNAKITFNPSKLKKYNTGKECFNAADCEKNQTCDKSDGLYLGSCFKYE